VDLEPEPDRTLRLRLRNRVTKLDRRIKPEAVRKLLSDTVWAASADDQVFTFGYAYDDAGLATKMTYPTARSRVRVRSLALEARADLEGAGAGNAEAFVRDSTIRRGNCGEMRYANGTVQTWISTTGRGKPDKSRNQDGNEIANLRYVVNGSGDILSINDNTYEYDGFDRLVGASTLLPGRTTTRAS